MRFSKLFGKTLREAPAEVTRTAEQLAMRAALMRPYNGWLHYLTVGNQVLQRIQSIAKNIFAELGAQAVELFINNDSLKIYRNDLVSYRDLPRLVFEDNSGRNIRANLFATNQSDVGTQFRKIYQGVLKAFEKYKVKISAVESGPNRTTFVIPHLQGNRALLICESHDCGYAAIARQATFKIPDGIVSELLPIQKVETPHCPTIAALAEYLKIETRQTIKAVMFMTDKNEFVFVVIRGDLDVSVAKLEDALNISRARDATEAEISAVGALPGYASPAGLKVAANEKERGKGKVTVIADPSIQNGTNFAAGANEAGFHFINVNYPRDFQATLVADIALAKEGATCARCGSPLRLDLAFGVGSCTMVGATELTYLDNTGRPEPVWLGTYFLDLEEILLAIIDQHHDEAGIIWPASVAPYDIHLVRLGKAPETLEAADKLYAELQASGKTVFYDDRDESPGVKFADADLIGLPIRLTISDKSLKAGGVEVKRRTSSEKAVIGLEEVLKSL